MRPKLSVRCGVVATIAVTTPLLSGCGASDRSRADFQLPAQNQTAWVMPLDLYVPVSGDLGDYAENLLIEPCMEKAGYTWAVPWRDVTASSQSDTSNAVGRRLFNRSVAAAWGYHDDQGVAAGSAAWDEFSASKSSIPDDEERERTSFIHPARKELPRLDGQDQLASRYGQAAFERAKKQTAVTAAAEEWRRCMRGEGISDLPASPLEMPTASMLSDLRIDPAALPGSDEIEVATKDADCRDSAGFERELYAAEWNSQVALLEQNADSLERIKSRIAKNRAATLAVITSNAPRR